MCGLRAAQVQQRHRAAAGLQLELTHLRHRNRRLAQALGARHAGGDAPFGLAMCCACDPRLRLVGWAPAPAKHGCLQRGVWSSTARAVRIISGLLGFSGFCAQDGNLVVYTNAGRGRENAVFATGTDGKGVPPYRLVVSSDSDGYLAVLDSADTVLFIRPAPAPPPPSTPAQQQPGGGDGGQEQCSAGTEPAPHEGAQQQQQCPAVETS